MSVDELIAGFVSEETPERIDALIRALQLERLVPESSRARVELELPPSPNGVERTLGLFAAWKGIAGSPGKGPLLAVALQAAHIVRRDVENRGPRCELAWTGPLGPYGVRTTDQVVAEMLEACRREAFLVQYAINIRGASSPVLLRLGELAREGVRVSFIVDAGWGDGRSVQSVRQHWPALTPSPRLYSYRSDDDALAKLHAKVLIVDERDLFVSSANLTGYGYGINLEFGVRVQGDPALQAQHHFERLLASDLLTEVDWASQR